MSFFQYFQKSKCDTADLAKDRLQALGNRQPTNIIHTIKEDILELLSGYKEVAIQNVSVKHDKKRSTLNLAIPID